MAARRGRSFNARRPFRQPDDAILFPATTTTTALDSQFHSFVSPHPPQSQPPLIPASRSTPSRGRRRQPSGRNASPDGRNQEPFDGADAEGSKDGGFINFEAYEDVPVEASGMDIPASASSFAEIDLGESLNKNISRCRYDMPTPIQRHAIPIALAGRDLMACAQTGSGKTAAFCLPIVCRLLRSSGSTGRRRRPASKLACPAALVLSPTRELSCQIHDEAKKFAYETGIKVGVAYGGAPFGLQVRNLERGVDVLVATPGRLVDMVERNKVSLRKVQYLAIDEADRMLDMGFEPQIRKIVEQMDMPPCGARQTLLFSATFPNDIQVLASDFLSNYIFLAVGRVGSSTELISQKVEFVEDIDKRGALKELLHARQEDAQYEKQELTLVFVETKRGADSLENWLCRNGFPAIAIHGDKVQTERERALRSFKRGATPIMVATDVASRGLDIPRVAHVVNFDFPKCIDDYVHRIGRTGRAGKTGLATAFFSCKNIQLAKPLSDLMRETNQEVPSWLAEYAAESFDDSSNNGVSRNHRGKKFGGRDFRRGPKFGNDTYTFDSNFEHYSISTLDDGAPAAYVADSYGNPTNYDYSSAAAQEGASAGGLGYESPSGWD